MVSLEENPLKKTDGFLIPRKVNNINNINQNQKALTVVFKAT